MGAFSCISIALAFAADVTPPQQRGAVFGFIMGSFSFGVVVGEHILLPRVIPLSFHLSAALPSFVLACLQGVYDTAAFLPVMPSLSSYSCQALSQVCACPLSTLLPALASRVPACVSSLDMPLVPSAVCSVL